MDELYAVGWRTPGQTRRWVVAVYPSVVAAAVAGGGYARFDGGGRWMVADGLEAGSRCRGGRPG